jgi:hypothetical protein
MYSRQDTSCPERYFFEIIHAFQGSTTLLMNQSTDVKCVLTRVDNDLKQLSLSNGGWL